MQTLEQRRREAEKRAYGSSHQPHPYYTFGFLGTVFCVSLVLFGFANLAISGWVSGKDKRKIGEVLLQAKEESAQKLPLRHTWGWWLAKLFQEEKGAPDVVIFGSSLVGSAHTSVDAQMNQKLTDVVTHRRLNYLEYQLKGHLGKEISVFSLACPGEMISDAYMITKALFNQAKQPKLVIAAIAPRDFVDSTLPYPGVTDQFKFFSNYVPLTRAVETAAYPDFWSRMGVELEKLPLKKFGKNITARAKEKTSGDFDQSESLRVEAWKSVVPANARPPWVDNSKEYIERFRYPDNANYKAEMHFFKEWITDLRSRNIEVMVVCMPTTEMNRRLLSEKFWKNFRSDVTSVCTENGADFMDLSDSGLFQPADYLDTVHLSAYGAIKLFPVMAERVKLVPHLANSLTQ